MDNSYGVQRYVIVDANTGLKYYDVQVQHCLFILKSNWPQAVLTLECQGGIPCHSMHNFKIGDLYADQIKCCSLSTDPISVLRAV